MVALPVLCPFTAHAEAVTQARSKAPMVQDAVDFHHHTRIHAQRVQMLGLKLRDKFFPDLNRQLAHDFLALHDQSKLHGADLPNSILKRLYSFYGKNANYLQGAERLAYQQLSQEIIQLDKYTNSAFINSRVSATDPNHRWIVQALLRIERLADVVDRSNDPVAQEEFGRYMRPVREVLNLTSEETEMVQYLDSIYPQIYLDAAVVQGISCQKILVQ
jgi:hypothetical protein